MSFFVYVSRRMYHMNNYVWRNLSPSEDRCDNGGPSSNNRPTDPIFIWNATVGLNFFNDSSYDILGNSPTFRTKFIIYPFYTQFQHGVLIRRGSPASYPFDVYYALLFVLVIWPYSSMFQIPVRSIRLCSRGINKQVCFPGPEFGISTNRVSFLFPSRFITWLIPLERPQNYN